MKKLKGFISKINKKQIIAKKAQKNVKGMGSLGFRYDSSAFCGLCEQDDFDQ